MQVPSANAQGDASRTSTRSARDTATRRRGRKKCPEKSSERAAAPPTRGNRSCSSFEQHGEQRVSNRRRRRNRRILGIILASTLLGCGTDVRPMTGDDEGAVPTDLATNSRRRRATRGSSAARGSCPRARTSTCVRVTVPGTRTSRTSSRRRRVGTHHSVLSIVGATAPTGPDGEEDCTASIDRHEHALRVGGRHGTAAAARWRRDQDRSGQAAPPELAPLQHG